MSTRITIEHLARVEGHGGATVELADGHVQTVRFDVFEGVRLLEGLVRGRCHDEVAPITSRICAICSAAHTLASLAATEAALGVEPAIRAARLRDLLLRGENIESHALHIFLLALPDYLNAPSALALADSHREAVQLALRLKHLGNLIQETVGGRAVHPVTAVVGGFAAVPGPDALLALREALLEGQRDVETALDLVAQLPAVDVGRSPSAYAALRATDVYNYAGGHEIALMSNGRTVVVPVPAYRSVAREHTVSHSHAKHSRWNGTPFMVGALARLAVNGDLLPPSGTRALSRLGLTRPYTDPLDNNRAQMVELVVDVERALELVEEQLAAGDTTPTLAPVRVRAGAGVGAVEAPRGLLIHSYHYNEDGRLQTADVVTPTALNAASIEHRLRRAVDMGPTDDRDTLRRRLEMVVRAYDPCISCSVHVLDRRRAP
jgi:coenzyme F420-reducing hydrogenase alpha subunit